MQRYQSPKGESGVVAYDIRTDGIVLQFVDGSRYLYNADAPGRKHVAVMKRLAESGEGLATYVNQNVRENYALRLR